MQTRLPKPVIRELRDQQIRFRSARLRSCSKLKLPSGSCAEIESATKTYPYEYVCFRITGYRPDASRPGAMSGERSAARSAAIRRGPFGFGRYGRRQHPANRCSPWKSWPSRFNVSTKTISRWRELGSVSRRLVFDGRKRVGFLRSSVDEFVKDEPERVTRGARFSQLSDEERRRTSSIGARRLARAGGCQSEIARRLAKRAGRSVETIRYTIRQFDKQHPGYWRCFRT